MPSYIWLLLESDDTCYVGLEVDAEQWLLPESGTNPILKASLEWDSTPNQIYYQAERNQLCYQAMANRLHWDNDAIND